MQTAEIEPILTENLADAAPQATVSARVRLVRKLTDLVILPLGRMSRNELSFTADILIQSLDQVDLTVRQDTATRIAGFAEVPAHLQRYLVLQPPAIAGPILQKASSIPETVLMEGAAKSHEHRQMIVVRDDLTPAVLDVLLSFGEADIIHHVLKQQDVTISDHAMETLVNRSEADTDIRDALLARLELRLQHGLTMFWWLDPRQRKAVIMRFSTDRSVIQEAMHDLFVETFTSDTPDPLVKDILKLIDRRYRPRGRNGEMVTMDVVERTLGVARLNHNDEINHAVGLLAGVSQETAGRILADIHGEPFAVMCKSVGLSRATFSALITDSDTRASEEEQAFAAERSERLIAIFDSIARDYSRTILRYWDWHAAFTAVEGFTPVAAETSEDDGYFGAV